MTHIYEQWVCIKKTKLQVPMGFVVFVYVPSSRDSNWWSPHAKAKQANQGKTGL